MTPTKEEKKVISIGQFILGIIMMLIAIGGITAGVASKLSAHSIQIQETTDRQKEDRQNSKEEFKALNCKVDKILDKMDEMKADNRRNRRP